MDKRLLDEAIDLAIRLQDDPAALEHVEEWRMRSAEHAEAWRKVAAIHGLAGTALKRRGTNRRAVLGTAGALALGGAMGWPALRLRMQADHQTGTGEKRKIALGGSSVEMGPDSAVALNGPEQIHLLRGLVYIDAAQPLSALAGDLRVLTNGAGFEMSLEDNLATLAVNRGEVQAPGQIIASGQRLRSGLIEAQGPETVASWRDNLLYANDEPLGILVERVARWLPGTVLVPSGDLGRVRISGVFDLNDPDGALLAAVAPAGARVRQVSPWMRIVL